MTQTTSRESASLHASIAAFQAMREGVANEHQWQTLAEAIRAAQRAGGRGVDGHLAAAAQALQAVCRRAMDSGSWTPTPLFIQEIEQLDTALDLFQLQTKELQ